MNMWELVSTSAYTLSFAFVETLFALIVVIGLGWIIPQRWIEEKYVPIISLLLIEASSVAVLLQYFVKYEWPKTGLLTVAIPVMSVSAIFVLFSPRIQKAFRAIASRLLLLSIVYISFDILGILIVIARNVGANL